MFTFPQLNRVAVWYTIVVLTAVSFTWSQRLSSVGIILLTAHWLCDKNLLQKLSSFSLQSSVFRPRSTVLGLITLFLYSFFFVHIIALLWSHHLAEGWQSIEVKLTFFILPLLFSTENYLDEGKTRHLFFIFSVSCCVSFVYSFLYSYHHYAAKGWDIITQRMSLSEGVMHAGYYSNYFAYALVWCMLTFIENKQLSKAMRLTLWCLIPFLLIALLLLISKTAMLFVGCFTLYILWLATGRIKNELIRMVVFICSILFFIGFCTQIPSIKKRIYETSYESKLADKNVTLENSTGSRMAAWQNEWLLIKEHWLIGYGTGEANPQLKNKLIQEGYTKLADDNMHTHNQVFHTWLNTGITGVLLLFGILVASAFFFFKQKNKLAFWLIPLIFFNMLTDDMLEIQAGIVFFVFFLTLFLYEKKAVKATS